MNQIQVSKLWFKLSKFNKNTGHQIFSGDYKAKATNCIFLEKIGAIKKKNCQYVKEFRAVYTAFSFVSELSALPAKPIPNLDRGRRH